MDPLRIVYSIAELLLSLHISLSNLLVLWVYLRTQHIRTVTNTYIFSLALTDFLAGTIGIPLTVYTVLTRAPHSYMPCLAIHSILCVLCTISTFHLLAIAIDKYVSICCKGQLMQQTSRYQRAVVLLTMAWTMGALVAILPLFSVQNSDRMRKNFTGECHFTHVIGYHYLVYVIFFGTIILPTILIIFCYTSIYSRIRDDEQQIKCFLRGRERERRIRSRRKLIRVLLMLVLTYSICWYPLYLLNTVDLFFTQYHSTTAMTLSAVVLSHFSCAINPLIYAYGMPGFKQALRQFFCLTTNDKNYQNSTYVCSAITTNKTRSISVDTRTTIRRNPTRKISAPIIQHRRQSRTAAHSQIPYDR
ncbi:unnamed protein product [Toxocara canis]|nr:unnamed protein product [Toxocara canis]